ncbi:MAG: hypothetical protein JW751_11085 [Polyangiaceae bacterium]|nr:hypothetical protein [Polyangiaceae bacterium]
MTKKQGLMVAAASAAMLIGCSSDEGGPATDANTGGVVNGTGGTSVATGGVVGTGGASGTGGVVGTGGASGTGGATRGTGGVLGTGGTTGGTGGVLGTGGATGGTGGIPGGSSGVRATGATAGTGGVEDGTGGVEGGTGGVEGGTGAGPTGGIGAGGNPGTGGEGTGGTSPIDPNASAAINACMDQLPWGARDMSAAERAPIVTAIINVCAEFAPPGPEWQTYCQMFLVGAINAESSYNVLAGVTGAGDDPTIGLLQIRYSSTVRDFVDYGPVDAMARVGCDFGTVTESDSYATKSEMMIDVNCNIALGTWYYLIFGSGNGGSDAVWVWEYCQGGGIAGSLHIGMACHLMGAEAAHSSLSGADSYYDNIKSWFDPCVTYSGTHPFELPLEPDMDKYCG